MAHSHQRPGALAAIDGTHRHGNNPRTLTGPTIEQLFLEEETTGWSPHSTPILWRDHEMEYDHTPNHKKSVLAKVRDKAKKWRNTLSKKKHNQDNTTPSWGVSLDDDEEEDPEYFGAPMYESETAPVAYKETARQHPRAVPVLSEKHVLPSSVNHEVHDTKQKSPPPGANKTLTKTLTEKLAPAYETVTEKLAPAYATVSDATHAIASKIQSLTFSTPATSAPNPSSKGTASLNLAEQAPAELNPAVKGSASPTLSAKALGALSPAAKGTVAFSQEASTSVSPQRAAHASVSPRQAASGTSAIDRATPVATTVAGTTDYHVSVGEQKWDKGVSVKEYIMQKLEPGVDERVLSQVISQAISPRKSPADGSVVDKMKEAVTSLLRREESSPPPVYHSARNSFSHIPISTNAHEVEEENHGRVLQAN